MGYIKGGTRSLEYSSFAPLRAVVRRPSRDVTGRTGMTKHLQLGAVAARQLIAECCHFWKTSSDSSSLNLHRKTCLRVDSVTKILRKWPLLWGVQG